MIYAVFAEFTVFLRKRVIGENPEKANGKRLMQESEDLQKDTNDIEISCEISIILF